MHLKWIVIIVALPLIMISFASQSHAQGTVPVCKIVDGAFYQPDVFPRFVGSINKLVLFDPATGENKRLPTESR